MAPRPRHIKALLPEARAAAEEHESLARQRSAEPLPIRNEAEYDMPVAEFLNLIASRKARLCRAFSHG